MSDIGEQGSGEVLDTGNTDTGEGGGTEVLDPDISQGATDYDGIAAWVQSRLLRTPDQLPTSSLTAEIKSTLRKLGGYYTMLPTYATLLAASAADTNNTTTAGDDLENMNEAVGLMIAARLRLFQPKTTPRSDLTKITVGSSRQFEYAAPIQRRQALEEDWMNEAWDAFRRITVIRAYVVQQRNAFQVFAPAGRRRTAENRGYLNLPLAVFGSAGVTDAFGNVLPANDATGLGFSSSPFYGLLYDDTLLLEATE